MMKRKVFLDMDGVLVDFVSAACRRHRMENPYENVKNLGIWAVETVWGMSDDDFMAPLKGSDFWEGLEWTADGRVILKMVEDAYGKENITLLSRPPKRAPEAYAGKVQWILNNLPDYADKFLLGRDKNPCANGNILIDDYDRNINEWREAGGIGILVPRAWNSAYSKVTLDEISDDMAINGNLDVLVESLKEDKAGLRVFESGAVRTSARNKPDFEGCLSPLVMERFGQYMLKHCSLPDGSFRTSDNWQAGIPRNEYLKSAFRHFHHWWMLHRGYQVFDENGVLVPIDEALTAVLFNTQGYLHELLKERLPKPPAS